MYSFPAEVIRLFLEHLSYTQRQALLRTCRLFHFLIRSFELPVRKIKTYPNYLTNDNQMLIIKYSELENAQDVSCNIRIMLEIDHIVDLSILKNYRIVGLKDQTTRFMPMMNI